MGRAIMAPLLLYTSKTGNTKTFANFIKQHVDNITICNDFTVEIENYDKLVIGAYTWGNGKIPRDLKQFLIDNQYKFKGKKAYIFGSGNSIYPKFCGAVDGISKILTDCGAEIVWKFKFEQMFKESKFSTEELNFLIEKLIG
jgi:flavodoxin I